MHNHSHRSESGNSSIIAAFSAKGKKDVDNTMPFTKAFVCLR